MQFITAKEFLNQSPEVQCAFMNWWEPEIGDLFTFRYDLLKEMSSINVIENKKRIDILSPVNIVPLLTEGQLRKFIEDKTICWLSTSYGTRGGKVIIDITICGGEEDTYTIYTDNMLEALWKVALSITK